MKKFMLVAMAVIMAGMIMINYIGCADVNAAPGNSNSPKYQAVDKAMYESLHEHDYEIKFVSTDGSEYKYEVYRHSELWCHVTVKGDEVITLYC